MSMKVLAITAHGDEQQLNLHQVARPNYTADDLLVKVSAFALNPVDTKVRSGEISGLIASDLKILGWDASGVVESVGSNVTSYKAGDEVYFSGSLARQGAYAEYVSVDYRLVALKPKSVDHVAAAAMPLTTLTAWEAFEDKFHWKIPTNDTELKRNAGLSVLITAGAGGVGSIAIQLAKHVFKIGKVISTAGRADSATWCRNFGADVVLDRSKDWKAQLQDNGIATVDYILSCAQVDDILDTLVSIVTPMGHICGIVINTKPLNMSPLFGKSLSFSWEFMGSRPMFHIYPERHNEILSQLATYVDNGTIKSWVGVTYEAATPENIRAGHILQASGTAIGKIAFVAAFP